MDYYNDTVFEFVTNDIGSQNTVLAGGRYDSLTSTMGFQKTPGIGWAAGIERLSLMLDKQLIQPKKRPIALILLDTEFSSETLKLAYDLRKKDIETLTFFGIPPKKQLAKAVSENCSKAIFVNTSSVSVKDLDNHSQKDMDPQKALEYLSSL